MKTGKSGWASLLYVYYTDRQTDCHEAVPTQKDRVPVLLLHADIGSGMRLSPLAETDRHTDCHETVCSYTGRQGSSTPTTHRYRVWHETFSSCRDRQTHRLSWDCSFTDRQATCPPTQEDVGLAQDFLLLQRQTVRDFSTFLVRLQCRTLEWFLERLPFTSTVIDQKIDCVSY